jgi:RNA polymerase primary sigma factor
MREIKINTGNKVLTNRDTISLKKYLTEVSATSVISANEEYELFMALKDGDITAKDKIIKANLRFVLSVAKHYINRGVSYEDLVSEGNIGLSKAVDKFDATKGFKFISYAVWWIRQSMLSSIYNNSKTVKIPPVKYFKINKIDTFRMEFIRDYDREPTLEEISEELEISVHEVSLVMQSFNKSVSVDAKNPTTETTLLELIPSESVVKNTEFSDNLKVLLPSIIKKYLNEDERCILIDLYGLDSNPALSVKELEDKLNLTRSQILNKRNMAIKRLRYEIERNKNLKNSLI